MAIPPLEQHRARLLTGRRRDAVLAVLVVALTVAAVLGPAIHQAWLRLAASGVLVGLLWTLHRNAMRSARREAAWAAFERAFWRHVDRGRRTR
jgi:hypothetical protein